MFKIAADTMLYTAFLRRPREISWALPEAASPKRVRR